MKTLLVILTVLLGGAYIIFPDHVWSALMFMVLSVGLVGLYHLFVWCDEYKEEMERLHPRYGAVWVGDTWVRPSHYTQQGVHTENTQTP